MRSTFLKPKNFLGSSATTFFCIDSAGKYFLTGQTGGGLCDMDADGGG